MQLTFDGRNERPFWSGDGRYIFFTSDRGEGPALWSMRPDGGEQTELLFAPGAVAYSISPDGQYTAYAQRVDGDYELFLSGELWLRQSGDQVNYMWSPDSSRILFESGDGAKVIYTLAVNQTISFPLTDPAYSSWNPTWAPDSWRLAFASTRDGNAGVYVINVDGSGLLRLTPLDAWSQAPSWSPDGATIAYVAGSPEGGWTLYAMNEDGSDRRLLLPAVYPEAMAVWSADSSQLAVILDDGDLELAALRGDGGGFTRLTDNAANDWGPVWEPR